MPPLPDAFYWQTQMADLIYTESPDDGRDVIARGWRCANAIDASTVLKIYRRNLKWGVEKNLGTQFPVTRAYLGRAGFRLLARELLQAHPPQSPLFSVFAAQLPGFVLTFSQFDEHLRSAVAALASIDFFSTHVAVADQSLEMDERHYELYRSILKLQTQSSGGHDDQSGLYQLSNLHPQSVAAVARVAGVVISVATDDGLIIQYQQS